ncbi:MAG: hypothetical protein ACI4NN_02585 [Pyramidobacter sp.]|jgi:hypothetical protein
MKFKIYAVGSNQFLSDEIRNAVRFILGSRIPIFNCVTSELINCLDGLVYICNQSQFPLVKKLIPKDKIVILNSTPTSQFYVQVAAIPTGSDVYVFNNKTAYINTLINDCHKRGIRGVNFLPLPYTELPPSQVQDMLSKAHYIIGVDYLLSENVLLSPPYIKFLRYDTVLIKAHRVGSVISACKIITKVNDYLKLGNSRKLSQLFELLDSTTDTDSLYKMYRTLSLLCEHLRSKSKGNSIIDKSTLIQIIPEKIDI